jgi:hypothetical protein
MAILGRETERLVYRVVSLRRLRSIVERRSFGVQVHLRHEPLDQQRHNQLVDELLEFWCNVLEPSQ